MCYNDVQLIISSEEFWVFCQEKINGYKIVNWNGSIRQPRDHIFGVKFGKFEKLNSQTFPTEQ